MEPTYRLTAKDGVTTLLAGVVVAITLAVTQGWDWPLLGTPRAGVLALSAVGIAMCIQANRPQETADGTQLVRNPGLLVGTILGSLSLVLIVVGLIVGTETVLVTLAAVLLLAWVIATARHALVPVPVDRGTVATAR